MALDRIRYNVFIDRAQLKGLRFVKDRDGILPAEQIRRAIDRWLEEKGVKVKSGRKRSGIRKRP